MEDDDYEIGANQELLDNDFMESNTIEGIEGESNNSNNDQIKQSELTDERDAQWGFSPLKYNEFRQGWLINIQSVTVRDDEWIGGRSALSLYFLDEKGEYFKSKLIFSPYFYIKCKIGSEHSVEEWLKRKFSSTLEAIERVWKEDLDVPNHLLPDFKRCYLQIIFRNQADLIQVRKAILPIATRNNIHYREPLNNGSENDENDSIARMKRNNFGQDNRSNGNMNSLGKEEGGMKRSGMGSSGMDPSSNIVDIREYDLPFHLRVSIDFGIRVGLWFNVQQDGPTCRLKVIESEKVRPDPIVLAFDIETTKSPLKFPNAERDAIMMISYMINGRGFLLTNREIVGQDIPDFNYTPRPDFPGEFNVYNLADELEMLKYFYNHIQIVRPTIFVTYNGDFFDWPFVEKRSEILGISMCQVIGIGKNSQDEYWSPRALHMDCFRWVKRDSYLPVGSQGLKAVTAAKLGYTPLEMDPEVMTIMAKDDPIKLSSYSISDAVSTYYLYMKYVHPFVFSLCTIIPLSPDEVLRKGSGTLCETLLMAEAFKANVIIPNKHTQIPEKFHNGHLVTSETYIGGHVEALECGVFRNDLPYKFNMKREALIMLIDNLDKVLKFFLEYENGIKCIDRVINYNEIYSKIRESLESFLDNSIRMEKPLIYHLDVAAMYPNIILTNRLQPAAMVDESKCALCDHNIPGKKCQLKLNWSWRGEFYSAKMGEYRMLKAQLENEKFLGKQRKIMANSSNFTNERNGKGSFFQRKSFYNNSSSSSMNAINASIANDTLVPFSELPKHEQISILHKRLQEYCKSTYRKSKQSKVMQQTSIVCQKENSFYIDTVRNFRDRRYDYKNLNKLWKKRLDEATSLNDKIKIEECSKMHIVYDSLQLAHKCILNSFYGYVMRKGARWYSMEMGGIVCEVGGSIIRLARELVEQVGRPLELDTDGIWCMFPSGFPQHFSFQIESEEDANGNSSGNASKKKTISFSYPCIMLNQLIHEKFTNHQYHVLKADGRYEIQSINSIFFEIDGPYKAMMIPSSKEEGKLLKKRYAVFGDDGNLAELKGFEVKRRGELKLVKLFQTQAFIKYLEGSSLRECYERVAQVALYWLNIIKTKAKEISDQDLFEFITENRSMSRNLHEYGQQKSTAISTARRLAEWLGEDMVKDKGLACKFVISARPLDTQVATRAIPTAIWQASKDVKEGFLRKWLKDPQMKDFDIRAVVDWQYYQERLESLILKLVVIPAGLQGVYDVIPQVKPPDWLFKSKGMGNYDNDSNLNLKSGNQRRITEHFTNKKKNIQENQKETTPVIVKDTFGLSLNSSNIPSSFASINNDIEDIANPKLLLHSNTLSISIKEENSNDNNDNNQIQSSALLLLDSHDNINQILPSRHSPLPIHLPSTNYSGWLVLQKEKWKKLRIEFAMNEKDRLDSNENLNYKYWKKNEKILNPHKIPWQILSIERVIEKENDNQNDQIDKDNNLNIKYLLWCLIGNLGFKLITIDAIKKFYIHSRNPIDQLKEFPTVQHLRLPDGNLVDNSEFLYEISIPEHVFYKENLGESWKEIPDIIGIYESRIDPLFNIISLLGSIIQFKNNGNGNRNENVKNNQKKKKHENHGKQSKKESNQQAILNHYSINDFEFKTINRHCPYFEDGTITFFHLFLYASNDNSRLVILIQVNKMLRVIVVDPSMSRQLPPLKQLIGNLEFISMEVDYFGDYPSAMRSIQRQIKFLVTPVSGITIKDNSLSLNSPPHSKSPSSILPLIIITNSINFTFKEKSIKSELIDKFNNIPIIQFNNENYSISSSLWNMPALDWQKITCKRLVDLFQESNLWLRERFLCSRYAHIPFGNISISSDMHLQILEIFYARSLRRAGILLFDPISRIMESELKLEKNSTFPINNSSLSNFDSSIVIDENDHFHNRYPEEHYWTRIERSTFIISSITVELDIQSIPLNSVLEYQNIIEEDHQLVHYPHLLALMKTMLLGLVKDAISHNNLLAKKIISVFYSWLTCSSCLSFGEGGRMDKRLICRNIQIIMSKCQMLLWNRLQELGLEIIYASNRMIIAKTVKREWINAKAYLEYIVRECREMECLSWIDIEIITKWKSLIWLDPHNFCGFLVESKDGREGEEMENEEMESKDENIKKEMESKDERILPEAMIRLHLSEFLPIPLQNPFKMIILEYFMSVIEDYESKREKRKKRESSLRLSISQNSRETKEIVSKNYNNDNMTDGTMERDKKRNSGGLVSFLDIDKEEEMENEEMENEGTISSTFIQRFLFLIRELDHLLASPDHDSEFDLFPRPLGCIVELENPILQFLNFAHHFISLDHTREIAVFNMIKNAMTLANLNIYSDNAEFKSPFWTVVIPQITCSQCGYYGELDLVRDVNLLESASSSSLISGEGRMGMGGALIPSKQLPNRILTCSSCLAPLHNIQNQIGEYLEGRLTTFLTQELECTHCHHIQQPQDNDDYCMCGRKWQSTVISTKEIHQDTIIINQIAKIFDWNQVRDLVKNVKKSIGKFQENST